MNYRFSEPSYRPRQTFQRVWFDFKLKLILILLVSIATLLIFAVFLFKNNEKRPQSSSTSQSSSSNIKPILTNQPKYESLNRNNSHNDDDDDGKGVYKLAKHNDVETATVTPTKIIGKNHYQPEREFRDYDYEDVDFVQIKGSSLSKQSRTKRDLIRKNPKPNVDVYERWKSSNNDKPSSILDDDLDENGSNDSSVADDDIEIDGDDNNNNDSEDGEMDFTEYDDDTDDEDLPKPKYMQKLEPIVLEKKKTNVFNLDPYDSDHNRDKNRGNFSPSSKGSRNFYSKEESKHVRKYDILGSGNFEIIRGGILDKQHPQDQRVNSGSNRRKSNHPIHMNNNNNNHKKIRTEAKHVLEQKNRRNQITDVIESSDEEDQEDPATNSQDDNNNNNDHSHNDDDQESFEPFNFDIFGNDPILQGFQGYDNFAATQNHANIIHV